jgi:hypothetical protein
MLYDNEVIMLLLGTGALFFVMFNKPHIRNIISWKLLMLAFYFLMAGWLLTVLEGFFWEYVCNFLEHLFYAVSALIMALWCRKVVSVKREEHQQ